MAYSFRQGAIVTFTREDGLPGPGETYKFPATEGWKVDIQDEGVVEISGYGRKPMPPSRVIPWHRIWEITSMS
jgi:hypothetical protein